jgi:hypothetical protein
MLSDGLSEREFGDYKVLACMADLNDSRRLSPDGFQLAFFESASIVASKDDASALAGTAKKLLKGRGNEVQQGIVTIGLDFVQTLSHFKLPGSGIFAKSGFEWAERRWSVRRGRLEGLIRELPLNNPEAIELMIRWIRYSVLPSEKTWRTLDDYVQRLAKVGKLFSALSDILIASRYASMIILIDQVENLLGPPTLTNHLIRLYDDIRPNKTAKLLNVFFVFAGTSDVSELSSEEGYGGFGRRFLDPLLCETIDVPLANPDISGGQDDDINRIVSLMSSLRTKFDGIPIPRLDDARVTSIRNHLRSQRTVSWPMLWRSVLS